MIEKILKKKIIYFIIIMVCYECHECYFKTNIKSHYFRHLKTIKHINNTKGYKEEEYENKRCEKKIMVGEKKFPHKTSQLPHKTSQIPHKTSQILKEHKILFCKYCNKKFTRNDNLKRHEENYCKNRSEREQILLLSNKVDQMEQKNKELENKVKQLENTKKIVNITNNTQNINNIDNSRTTNYLNITLPDMLDIDTFIQNLMTTHRLDNDKTSLLLESFKTCGLISYGNNLSRTLKENCYQQIKDMEKDSKGIKMIPIVTTDSNLRSYKEKSANGWKKADSDKRLNDIINISNDQIYKNHKEPIYLDNKDKKKVKNIIKKDHGIGELTKQLEEDVEQLENGEENVIEDESECTETLFEEYIDYSAEKGGDNESIFETEKIKKPEYDKKNEYLSMIDCGREYIYDTLNGYVFNENKEYIGKRVHDNSCPYENHNNSNCWYYVEYVT